MKDSPSLIEVEALRNSRGAEGRMIKNAGLLGPETQYED